jgi:hypothetical protein
VKGLATQEILTASLSASQGGSGTRSRDAVVTASPDAGRGGTQSSANGMRSGIDCVPDPGTQWDAVEFLPSSAALRPTVSPPIGGTGDAVAGGRVSLDDSGGDSIPAASHIAVYGCAMSRRTFRALVPGAPPSKMGKSRLLTIPVCPGCGYEHTVADMARARRPGEEVDVLIGNVTDDGPPPMPEPDPEPPAEPQRVVKVADPDAPDHRQRWSDDEIRTLLTTEPQRAAAVARELGASQPSTVAERCAGMEGVEVFQRNGRGPYLVVLVEDA